MRVSRCWKRWIITLINLNRTRVSDLPPGTWMNESRDRWLKCFRSLVSLLGLTLASATLLLPIFVLGLVDRSGRLGWFSSRLWAWTVLVTGGVQRIRSQGFEYLNGVRGAIVMSNHESLFDPIVMMVLSKAPIRFFARQDLFYLPLFGWAMWSNGHLAVRRGSRHDTRRSLGKAAQAIAGKNRVLIYPEGTRSDSSELLPFKKGGFLLAVRSGAPIIPVGIADTRKVCPKGWHLTGSSPVSAVVGRPIDTTGYTSGTSDVLMEVVRRRILELRSEAVQLNARAEG